MASTPDKPRNLPEHPANLVSARDIDSLRGRYEARTARLSPTSRPGHTPSAEVQGYRTSSRTTGKLRLRRSFHNIFVCFFDANAPAGVVRRSDQRDPKRLLRQLYRVLAVFHTRLLMSFRDAVVVRSLEVRSIRGGWVPGTGEHHRLSLPSFWARLPYIRQVKSSLKRYVSLSPLVVILLAPELVGFVWVSLGDVAGITTASAYDTGMSSPAVPRPAIMDRDQLPMIASVQSPILFAPRLPWSERFASRALKLHRARRSQAESPSDGEIVWPRIKEGLPDRSKLCQVWRGPNRPQHTDRTSVPAIFSASIASLFRLRGGVCSERGGQRATRSLR